MQLTKFTLLLSRLHPRFEGRSMDTSSAQTINILFRHSINNFFGVFKNDGES